MQEALNQKIDAFVAANKEQILKDIATLVSINSVEGAPEEGAPYGAGPRAALDKTLELAAGMGLATRNCENHIGYAELAGADAEKYLATICHVDVVPEGNGWTEDPFKMEIRDGWMIGRGVADDKGPMVATLYALKFLKEEGVSLRYPIRALVGDNEETHMHDVDYYLANYPAPVFCFTPDAEFPVCNGEKGHFDGKLVSPVCNGIIKDFVGGVATNAVPDRASALVATDITKLRNAPNITLEPEGDGVRIRGWGKSGHAAMPEGTVNAIGLVVNYLLDNGLCPGVDGAGGLIHQADDLGQGGVISHLGSPHLKISALVDRGADYLISHRFIHRDALSRQGRLVYRAAALQDNAVYRDVFTGADYKDISFIHLVDGDLCLCAVSYHHGSLGSQLHQPL